MWLIGQTLKALTSFLLVLCLLIGASSCGSTPSGDKASPQATSASTSSSTSASTSTGGASTDNVLRVGMERDYVPFGFRDPNGTLVGFDVDLMQAIGRASGLQVTFVESPWPVIASFLETGTSQSFDAVLENITPETQHVLAFSNPYFNAGQRIAVRADSAIATPADLDGKRVGIEEDSDGGEAWVRKHVAVQELVTYVTVRDALAALVRSEIDAVVHDNPALSYITLNNPDLGVTLVGPLLTIEQYGIGVRQDFADRLPAINQGLANLRASGEYDLIYEKWFGNIPSPPSPVAADIGTTPPPATTEATPTPSPLPLMPTADATDLPLPSPPPTAVPTSTNTVEILVVYGSEKQAWLEPLVHEYNAAGYTTPQGSRVVVSATPLGSIEAAEGIIAGTIQATVWIPASSLYVPLAQRDWRDAHGTELTVAAPRELIRSPVVIAMWEPMAKALGWPERPIGWATIQELSGTSWFVRGYPEWGDFKFGHTHPDHSNSGLAALLSEAYAGASKQSGLTVEDLSREDVRTFMTHIESSIIDYGRSTGFFADRMLDCEIGGPSFLSGAVLYENLVAAQKPPCPGHPPLVAIYPSDGTFWSDHPYVTLNASWVTEEHRAAASDFEAFLRGGPQQQRALDAGFRPSDSSISIGPPLVLQNGVDPAEPRAILEVPPAEVIRAAQQTWRTVKKPADIVVLVDTSGSMAADSKIEQARLALHRFVDLLGDKDRLQITTFSHDIATLSPLSPLGEKRSEVEAIINSLQPDGPTPLHDATMQVYENLKTSGSADHIRAIVVLSDGRDEQIGPNDEILPGSTHTLEEMLNAIQIGDEGGKAIKLFTIAYGADADRETLQRMAHITGGEPFDSGPDTIQQVYEQIAIFF
ncbi:MAG: transporter substrate-binding domain-containing protein [Chloroflexaceae bacterium]|nr:transporter substrate-binding domain-containing protein [Chloroflexaceae bacterium]